ncbi:MAG: hypothetical protein H8D05_00035 [FCB group bacterium]|nr:hypothetical protein [FCB group bacterium]
MNISLDVSLAKTYTSKSQITRVITENWVNQMPNTEFTLKQ